MSMGRSRVVSEMGRYSLGRSGHCQIVLGATELPRKLDRITDVLIRCILLDGN